MALAAKPFLLHPNDDMPDIPVSRSTRIDSGSAALLHDEQAPMAVPSPARAARLGPSQLAVRTSTSDVPGLRREWLDLNVAVEPEPEPEPQAAPEVLVERSLAQDRTAFFTEVSHHCNLTGRTQVELSAQPALVLNHRMDPDARLDAVFPLRDPARPLTHVHARYANADGSLSERVGCTEVALDTGIYSYLRTLASQRDGRLPTLGPAQWTALVRSLERDMMSEIQRLIAGTPAQPPRCVPRRLSEQDLPESERAALTGHYGLFVNAALEGVQRPLLSNGNVLGVYMGALLETDEDLEQYRQEHPSSVQYEMDIDQSRPEPAVVAALGAANSTAFANTALRFDGDRPCYDHERLNAIFLPFRAQMTDNAGEPRAQSFMALVALDNLYASSNPSREVRVNYGDAYLEQFKNPPPHERTSPTPTPRIKPEPLQESSQLHDVAMAEAAAPVSSSEPSPAAAMPAAQRRRLDVSGRYQSDQSASSSRTAAYSVADPTAAAERPEGNAHGRARRRVPVQLTIDTQIAHEAWLDPDIATDESSAAAQGADDSALIAAIREAVPGPHKSKNNEIDPSSARKLRNLHAPDTPRTVQIRTFLEISAPVQGWDSGYDRYRRLLDENERRAEKWPDQSMRKAARIKPANARTLRNFRAPDSPRTAQARSFLEASAPAQGADNGFDRYRRLLAENDRRAVGEKWSNTSMQKAAGIDPTHAKRIRDLHAPDTPRTAQARSFMEASTPAQGADSAADKYCRGLEENDRRAEKWPDQSLQKAAGIDHSNARLLRDLRAPDTPRTAQARWFMEDSAPAQGADSGFDRYRRGRDENERRAEKWPEHSLQKAAGINPSNAKSLRDLRAPDTPRTVEARSFMDGSAPAQGGDSKTGRYRRGLNENDRRAEKWSDKSLQKAAGIDRSQAKKVRDRRTAGLDDPIP
ncbi:MAG: hypothetical protein JF606_27830 [Burkholderiales bacterium]|nr:hypothetical protein [Burkholderiales bacterium]